jgi:hypothetical protein
MIYSKVGIYIRKEADKFILEKIVANTVTDTIVVFSNIA